MTTLKDHVLNEVYVYLFRDKSIPPGRLKKWADKLVEVDHAIQEHARAKAADEAALAEMLTAPIDVPVPADPPKRRK